MSELAPLRLGAATSDLPAGAHANYRGRAGSNLAVLTAEGLPAPSDGKAYQAWVRQGNQWTSFGTFVPDADGTATNQVTWKVGVANPHNVAITPDGKTAYVASQGQNAPALASVDLTTGTLLGTIALENTPRAMNVSPDDQELFFTEAGVDAVQVLDIATNQLVDQIPVGASPHLPSFTPDGKLGLVVAQGPGELDLVDPDAYTTLGAVKVGTMPHWTAATSDRSRPQAPAPADWFAGSGAH